MVVVDGVVELEAAGTDDETAAFAVDVLLLFFDPPPPHAAIPIATTAAKMARMAARSILIVGSRAESTIFLNRSNKPLRRPSCQSDGGRGR